LYRSTYLALLNRGSADLANNPRQLVLSANLGILSIQDLWSFGLTEQEVDPRVQRLPLTKPIWGCYEEMHPKKPRDLLDLGLMRKLCSSSRQKYS
jgi:hypothetical protein